MKVALVFVTLSVILTLCAGYESQESNESPEDILVNRGRANSFLYNGERGNNKRAQKSPVERQAEICEDYSPCRAYAYRHGSQNAFERYFPYRYVNNGRRQ